MIKKILIVNQPYNNRGDESAHKALITKINKEFPDIRVTVLFINVPKISIENLRVKCENNNYVNIDEKSFFVKFMRYGMYFNLFTLMSLHPTIRNFVRIVNENDIVLCAPGGICMGGFQNWHHIFQLYVSMKLKKPIFYYGRSFGPFLENDKWQRKFKEISYELLHYFTFLSIRDKNTQKLADKIGVSYSITVDSAFLLSDNNQIPTEINDLIGNDKYMVFVPNLLIWHFAYRNFTKHDAICFFKKVLQAIIDKDNIKVIMLPQTHNWNSYEGDDLYFFKELSCEFNSNNIVVLSDTYDSNIQQSIIAKAQYLVGARYHSVVFAINQNIPFVALSYEHKISGLLELLGSQDCLIDISDVFNSVQNQDNIISNLKKKLDCIDACRGNNQLAKIIAENCFDQFKSQIETL